MKKIIISIFLALIFVSAAYSQEGCYSDYTIDVYGYSIVLFDDNAPQLVSGVAGTDLYIFGYVDPYCEDFDAGVRSRLYNANTNQTLGQGSLTSDGYSIQGYYDTFYAISENTYCVTSDHGFVYWWVTPWGWNSQVYRVVFTQACHTFPTPPPPCASGACPNPTPTVSITPIEIVEKNGERTVNVTVANNAAGTTKFSLRTSTNTTGSATFADGSSEITVTGNTINQALRIKGVAVSSQADNIFIEAKLNNSQTVSASDAFTIAEITSLQFERFNTGDIAFDPNPGNGQPNSNVGLRIYPDKINPSDGTDRSIVRVRAVVSPAVPNMKVYFASFDLDDPSTDALPVDTTGLNGNDNNCYVVNVVNNCSAVSNSKSGQLRNPDNGNCTGTAINADVSKIECSVSGNTALTNYKVTMQPGDNFAVAANLTGAAVFDAYHNFGGILTDANNYEIHISGENNSSETAGIRTNMLTVWRKLHIEMDSMSPVPLNHETGNITVGGKVSVNQNIVLQVNINLPLSRFVNGRLVTGGLSFPVLANDSNQIIVRNTYSTGVTIKSGLFDLYDDDEYNNTGTPLSGDEGESIVPLPETLKYLNPADNVAQNLYASAYVMPEYLWANPFNHANIPFDLNVDSDNTNTDELSSVLNSDRNSAGLESNDFWIAYFVLGYQGTAAEDADGCRIDPMTGQCVTNSQNLEFPEKANPGISKRTLTSSAMCDCFQDPNQSLSCPLLNQPGIPNPVICTQIPTGAYGSLLYQEVQQDVNRSWLLAGNTVAEIETTAPHELGHQFGLSGDQVRTLFGIMDYAVLPTANPVTLHSEHINLIRRRVKSPGQ